MVDSGQGLLPKETLVMGDFVAWFGQRTAPIDADVESLIISGEHRGEETIIFSADPSWSRFSDNFSSRVKVQSLSLPTIEERPQWLHSKLLELRLQRLPVGQRILLDMASLLPLENPLPTLLSCCELIFPLLMEGGLGILCYYDRVEFAPTFCVDVLPLHSRVYIDGSFQYNRFYHPLGNDFARKCHTMMLEHILSTLASAEGAPPHRTHLLDPENTASMLEAIVDSMGAGVVVGDQHGNMIMFNKTSEEIMGFPLSSLPYAERIRKFGNFLPDKETPYPLTQLPLARAIRGESFDHEEIFVKNENRDGVWISCIGRPVLDKQGRAVGGVLVSRDVTKEKEAAEEKRQFEVKMAQTQKMESLGLLAGGIAHDFNNLLMGVLGNVGLVLMEGEASHPLKHKLEHIRVAATRLSDLTNQLLAYSGRGTLIEGPVSLSTLAAEMRDLLTTVVSKRATLQADFPEDVSIIKADATQLRQVIMNLITNASDALGANEGTIKVATGNVSVTSEDLTEIFFSEGAAPGDYVFLEVEDSGCGMDKETLARIFDPFFTTKFKGRGLGLAAVLGLVRRHGGMLHVESSVGHGTRFIVLFPAAGPPERVSPDQTETETFRGEGTVLIVDDEELVRIVAREMLEHGGYSVLEAENGAQAIELYREKAASIQVVLLDMTMPDMNGEQVLQSLKGLNEEVTVILSSGYSERDVFKHVESRGVAGYLQKPYMPEALFRKVREATSANSA